MEIMIVLFAAFCRYAQGNGLGGEGRWMLLVTILAGGWFGTLDGQIIYPVEAFAVFLMAGMGWATVAFGRTEWANIKYSILRYTAGIAGASVVAYALTGRTEFLLYILAGPALTAIYYYVQEHKPYWLERAVRGRDVAGALAGGVVGAIAFL